MTASPAPVKSRIRLFSIFIVGRYTKTIRGKRAEGAVSPIGVDGVAGTVLYPEGRDRIRTTMRAQHRHSTNRFRLSVAAAITDTSTATIAGVAANLKAQ